MDEEEFFNKEKESMSIHVYKDIAFTHNDSAKFFSSSTGEMYSKENITSIEATSNTIDLVEDRNILKIAFKSPTFREGKNSEEKTTKIQHKDVTMTAEEFDAMKDDIALKNLTIANDNGWKTIFFKGVFLFETSNGKKGAIKVKKHDIKQIIVDIKVMK